MSTYIVKYFWCAVFNKYIPSGRISDCKIAHEGFLSAGAQLFFDLPSSFYKLVPETFTLHERFMTFSPTSPPPPPPPRPTHHFSYDLSPMRLFIYVYLNHKLPVTMSRNKWSVTLFKILWSLKSQSLSELIDSYTSNHGVRREMQFSPEQVQVSSFKSRTWSFESA